MKGLWYMKKFSLLDRAGYDYKHAALAYDNYTGDEGDLDIIAYHVHQTLEKLMKFELEMVGVEFPFTHEVHILYECMSENGLKPPAWIFDNYVVLNNYATQTRYGENLIASYRLLTMLKDLTGEYLNKVRREQGPCNEG